METKQPKSPLFIIFTTVLVDLIGFGMVIPLIGLYGRHYGASRVQLAFLGGIYSLMQFLFSPFWGSLSDRIGTAPDSVDITRRIHSLVSGFWTCP